MWLASLLVLLLTVAAFVGVRRSADAVGRLQSDVLRTSAGRRERARFLRSREAVADVTVAATDSVALGAAVVQLGHGAIASIPFGVLDAIPATSEGSRRVRHVHDRTASGVYRGIAAVSGAIGSIVSRKMTGEQPPADD